MRTKIIKSLNEADTQTHTHTHTGFEEGKSSEK